MNPYRDPGPEDTRGVEVVDTLGDCPGHPRAARGQRREHHRVLEGSPRVRAGHRPRPVRRCPPWPRAPRPCGLPGAGAAPLVLGHPVTSWRPSPRPSGIRQPGLVGHGGRGPGRVRRTHRRVTDEQRPEAHRWLSSRQACS
ncbi:hypothetical protein QJS66_00110 [Kocuria rhizophila]|nr:hypothetical protein QJS66_00110 [Kocuria rhizophila]